MAGRPRMTVLKRSQTRSVMRGSNHLLLSVSRTNVQLILLQHRIRFNISTTLSMRDKPPEESKTMIEREWLLFLCCANLKA